MSENILNIPIQINGGTNSDNLDLKDRELYINTKTKELFVGIDKKVEQINSGNARSVSTMINDAGKFKLYKDKDSISEIAGFEIKSNGLFSGALDIYSKNSDMKLKWILHDALMSTETGDFNTVSEDNTLTGIQSPSQGVWSFAAGVTDYYHWSTAPFRVSHKGELFAENANIIGKVVSNEDSILNGKTLAVDSAKIGDWNVQSTYLTASGNNKSIGLQSPSNGKFGLAVGITNPNQWSTAPFRVTHEGALYADNAVIIGKIISNPESSLAASDMQVSEATIGKWKFGKFILSAPDLNAAISETNRATGLQTPSSGVYSLAIGISDRNRWKTAPFKVTHGGIMSADGATITNSTITGGTVSGWQSKNKYLTSYKDDKNYINLWSRNDNNDFLNIKYDDKYTFILRQDGTLKPSKIELMSSMYGSSLPKTGVEGQLFFKVG